MGRRLHSAGWRVGIALVWLVGWLLVAAAPSAAQTVPVPSGAVRGGGGGGNTPGTVRLRDGHEAASERVIVRFRDSTPQGEQDDTHRRVGGRVAARATPRPARQIASGAQVVEVAGASVDDAVVAYRADARVLYAQPDFVRYAFETPTDPSVGSQYGLTRIGAPAAWNVTHGSPTIKIAVLDCGIHEAHPDLAGKVVLRQDFTGSPYGTDDRCNHGTHVAGIASAVTNNGEGVAGVGYNTSLMNGKVLRDNGGTGGDDSEIVNGIYWAVTNGAKVINMSFGGGPSCAASPAMRDLVDYAVNNNVVVVASAGNGGNTVGSAPGDCANAVSVASTDTNDVRSGFSTYGTWVKIAAPGSSILSSVNPDLSTGGNPYGYKSGTSMAAPHVAGVAALIWATEYGTSAQAVVNRMYATANPIGGTGVFWQNGRVNVGAAVAGGGRLPAPAPASLGPASAVAGSADFTLTVDGADFFNGAKVRWNGTDRPTTYVSATRLTATILAGEIGSAGSATVTVENPDGQVSRGLPFMISPPRPIRLEPSTGPSTGGQAVTLLGGNFRSGATVTIGGSPCRVVREVDSTALVCITSPGAAGFVDVIVTNTDGTSGTAHAAYGYLLRTDTLPTPGANPNLAPPVRTAPAPILPNAQPNAAPPRR